MQKHQTEHIRAVLQALDENMSYREIEAWLHISKTAAGRIRTALMKRWATIFIASLKWACIKAVKPPASISCSTASFRMACCWSVNFTVSFILGVRCAAVIPFAPYGSAVITWTQKTLHPHEILRISILTYPYFSKFFQNLHLLTDRIGIILVLILICCKRRQFKL